MASSEAATIDRKLNDIFEEGFTLYYNLENRTDATNSTEFQAEIKRCCRIFEDCTRLVSVTDLFSSNESFEEIGTNDLKFFLLPFFLGQLSQKLSSETRSRINIVEVSEVYYRDFLKRCEQYGIIESRKYTNQLEDRNSFTPMEDLAHQAIRRNQKIERFKQKKEMDDQIKQLKLLLERDHYDDDVKRKFYLSLIKSSIFEAEDDYETIVQEKQMLEIMIKNRQDNPDMEKKPLKRPPAPLKPIIITKDLAQKAIYGIGYPSIPTMTVSEFYDKRVQDGVFPDPANQQHKPTAGFQGQTTESEEREEVENDEKEDRDDEEHLARARRMDELKDEVRRGDGNRYNRS